MYAARRDKDSLYFVSNTPLNASQHLRGRAFYDRFSCMPDIPNLGVS